MSAPIIPNDVEDTTRQAFEFNRSSDLYDLERQTVRFSSEGLDRHGQSSVTEDQEHIPGSNREVNPRSQENQIEQESRRTTQSRPKYHEFLGTLWPFAIFLKQPCDKPVSITRPILQCCFLCFRGRRQQSYAVFIPCFRPRPQYRRKMVESQNGTARWEEKVFIDSGFESDSTIYKKLNEACSQYQLMFKRWVPFYGIVDVREVKVGVHILFVLLIEPS